MTAIAYGRSGTATTFAGRLLNFTLFATMVLSSLAFIEPSPYDAMMFALLMACVVAHVRFDRKLTPLLVVTALWLIGGALSLMNVGDDDKAIQYFGTSFYMGFAAILFACLFSDGDLIKLGILRRAYLIAALIATVAGYAGFFHLVPGYEMFLNNERLSATFKDPNVYGPFLVYPLVLMLLGFLSERITPTAIGTFVFLLGGLFLSFSRGAWIHFGVSALVAVMALYLSSPDPRMRRRIVMYGLLALFGVTLLLIALTSIESVRDMLLIRAKAIQPYDVGPGGRFSLQEIALGTILDNPNGLGPFEFYKLYGQQHNVYLQGFLVYGWLGGTMYLLLVLLTLMVGLRSMLTPTPWQNYLIAAYGALVGEAIEGAIIDSDHWRHFFLIVGLVWGLSVATINWRRGQASRRYSATTPVFVAA